MCEEIKILMGEYLSESFPISRVKLPDNVHGDLIPTGGMKTKSNFKRVIVINESLVFKIANKDQRYGAMQYLSNILCKTFHVNESETIPIIKIHLHIK